MGNNNSGGPTTVTQDCLGEPGPTECRSWGNAAMMAKDYPKAIDDFTHGIATSRNEAADADLYASRAACFVCIGQYMEALADAEACIRLRPDWADGFVRKGEALEGLVRLDEAVVAFEGALEIDPHSPELLDKVKTVRDRATRYTVQVQFLLSGNQAKSEQNFPKAIEDYTKAIEADPHCEATAAIYANRAECHSLLGHHADALADANACVRLRPDSSEGYVRRGTALEGVGRLDKAVTAYEFALAVDPNNKDIDEKLTAVRARCDTEIQKQLSQNSDDYTREVDPNCEAAAAIYSNRAASLTSLKRYPEALADADACIRLRPDWHMGYFRKGAALEGLGQLDEALTALEFAVAINPGNPDIEEKLAAVRARCTDPPAVQCQLETMGNKSSLEAKNIPKAIGDYTKVIDADPKGEATAPIYANRSVCYASLGNYEDALTDADECIRLRPDWHMGYFRKGAALEGLGQLDEALTALEFALAINPSNPDTEEKLAAVRARCSEMAGSSGEKIIHEPIGDRTKAINANPKNESAAAICAIAAVCHSTFGNHADALEAADECIRLRPEWSAGYVRRGTALEDLGRVNEAMTAFDFALAVDPNSEDIEGTVRTARARMSHGDAQSLVEAAPTDEAHSQHSASAHDGVMSAPTESQQLPSILRAWKSQQFEVPTLQRSKIDFADMDPHHFPIPLGTGSTCAVYRAHVALPGSDNLTTVAFKKYHPNVGKSIRNEITAFAKILRDPTVVRLLGVVVDNTADGEGAPVGLVLELMEGGNLLEHVQRQDRAPEELYALMGVACRAVRHMHSLNVIHGDLKLENFLMTAQGEPKIADFGSAAVVAMAGRSTTTTGGKGTTLFTAPEHALGEKLTKACDVFGVGMSLWAITHPQDVARPFKDKLNEQQILLRIVNSDRPNIDDHIPTDLKKLIERCWDQDPANRPSIEEVVRIVEVVEQDECKALHATLGDADEPFYVFRPMPTVTDDVLTSIRDLIPEDLRHEFYEQGVVRFIEEKAPELMAKYPGITRNHVAAIHAYTMHFPDTYTNLFRSLNHQLARRVGAQDPAFAPFTAFLHYLVEGLRHIPMGRYEYLYRGLRTSKSAVYTPGRHVYLAALTSTSTSHAKMLEFAGSAGTLMAFKDADGYPIKDFSMFPDEDEILLPPNTRVKITLLLTGEHARDMIHLITSTSLQTKDLAVVQFQPQARIHPLTGEKL